MKEENKIEVIQGVMDGKILVDEAGRILNRSVRQIFRMLKKLSEKDSPLEKLDSRIKKG